MENTVRLRKGQHYHDEHRDFLNRDDLFNGHGVSPLKRYWVHTKKKNFKCVIFVRIDQFYEFYHNDADILHGFGCVYMYGIRAHTGIPVSVAEKYTQLLTVNGYNYTFMDHEGAKEWLNTESADEKICKMVYAITTQSLLIGDLPTNAEKLMSLFKDIPASREKLWQLAKDNRFEWVRDVNHPQKPEEYKKKMNKALAQYLSA